MNTPISSSGAFGRRFDRVLADRLVPVAWRGVVADALLVAGGALLVAVAARIEIPLGFTPVPISGQTFGVLLVGASLGSVRGASSLALYLLLGLAGAPVFAGGASGTSWLVGPTGGYLAGFIAAAALLGALAERGRDRRIGPALVSMVAASALIYAFGVAGLILTLGVDLGRAIELGVIPFLVGDVVKSLLAAAALPTAWSIVWRLPSTTHRETVDPD